MVEEADRLARQVLESEPNHVGARVLLATLAGKAGRTAEAEKLLREALAIEPSHPQALDRLAGLLRHLGKTDEAIQLSQRALERTPNDIDALETLGRTYLGTQQLAQAEATFRRAVEVAGAGKRSGILRHHLGMALYLQGRNSEAIAAFRSALASDRGIVPAYLRLAQLLIAQGERGAAIEMCEEALDRQPGLADAHVLWAEALQELGKTDEAELHLRQAAATDPKIGVQHGGRLQILGRFEEATKSFERALEMRPQEAAAYGGLVRSKKLTEADRPLIERMLALVPDERLTPPDKIALHYALGKAFDDLGDYGAAMRHFNEANGIAAAHMRLRFDAKVLAANNDRRIATFSRELFERHKGRITKERTPKPIFIVGMIRSGTTLVEQAISNHPQVGAAGELRFWSERERELTGILAQGDPPDVLLDKVADDFVELLARIAPGKPFVTDKMPLNFAWLGLIHLVFPDARIVHCRRSPIDNCLSIYTTQFDSSPPFAHVPENIVAYYRQYERLMEHWQRTFPKGSMLEVRYEDVVADREAVLRKIVEYCGIGWDESLLHHEENQRAVRTPSMWQVRQPIYTTSVERWRRYEPWLGEFARLKPPN